MINPVYIEDIFESIVQKVSDQVLTTIQANETVALGKTLIQTIDYQIGHLFELVQTLSQMDKSVNTRILKYPLVWLVTDFTETRGKQPGVYADTKLHVCIIHQTDSTYKAMDRKEKVFKPVLLPIYYSLIEQIANSTAILEGPEDLIIHSKTNRYFLGSNNITVNKNTLNDYVDAVEIENLNLKFYYNNCINS